MFEKLHFNMMGLDHFHVSSRAVLGFTSDLQKSA